MRLGVTGGAALTINTSRGRLAWTATRLRDVWWKAIQRLMGD
jgi:hypothetical protein